jgi:hypothetical protein
LVSRVAAGLHHGDVHATAAHVLSRELGQPRANATPLILRIDPDDVDTPTLMEGVHGDRDAANRPSVRHRDEHVPFLVGTRRSDRVSLIFLPA